VGAREYLEKVSSMVERLTTEQLGPIRGAADMVARVIREDGIVHVFGTGHSHMLAEESLYRAGGLAPVNALLDSGLMLHEGATASTQVERLSGYAKIVAGKHRFEPRDLLIAVSNSGVNAAPVEMALLARKAGLKVIAVCSLSYSRSLEPGEEVPARLPELADIVLDNLGEEGDAAVELHGHDLKVGPTSTVLGVALLNAVFVEAASILAGEGAEPPVYRSSNMPGAAEHNQALIERFRGRVRNL
jgi:uncharacterized phosphosugar-binding protein